MSVINLMRILALTCLISACGDGGASGTPAPIGEVAALEKLAASYEEIMEQMPGTPWALPPEDRKRFVEQVFAKSGYNYRATLLRMAEGGWSGEDKSAKDLSELLFMPHSNLSPGLSIDGVYNEEELAAVRKIQGMLP